MAGKRKKPRPFEGPMPPSQPTMREHTPEEAAKWRAVMQNKEMQRLANLYHQQGGNTPGTLGLVRGATEAVLAPVVAPVHMMVDARQHGLGAAGQHFVQGLTSLPGQVAQAVNPSSGMSAEQRANTLTSTAMLAGGAKGLVRRAGAIELPASADRAVALEKTPSYSRGGDLSGRVGLRQKLSEVKKAKPTIVKNPPTVDDALEMGGRGMTYPSAGGEGPDSPLLRRKRILNAMTDPNRRDPMQHHSYTTESDRLTSQFLKAWEDHDKMFGGPLPIGGLRAAQAARPFPDAYSVGPMWAEETDQFRSNPSGTSPARRRKDDLGSRQWWVRNHTARDAQTIRWNNEEGAPTYRGTFLDKNKTQKLTYPPGVGFGERQGRTLESPYPLPPTGVVPRKGSWHYFNPDVSPDEHVIPARMWMKGDPEGDILHAYKKFQEKLGGQVDPQDIWIEHREVPHAEDIWNSYDDGGAGEEGQQGGEGDMAYGPQFQANRPQGMGSNVIQMQQPQHHKGSVLGTLAGVGMGIATGNWAPLASTVLGSAMGGAIGQATGDQPTQTTTPAEQPNQDKTSESSTAPDGMKSLDQTTPQAPAVGQMQLPPEVWAAVQRLGIFGQQPTLLPQQQMAQQQQPFGVRLG